MISGKNHHFELINGRLPNHENEILIVKKSKNHEIKIDDNIQLTDLKSTKTDILKQKQFKVVGEVTSNAYISNLLGNTSIQNGKIDYVIFVNEKNLTNENPTHVSLHLANLEQLNPFSTQYKTQLSIEKEKFEVVAKNKIENQNKNLMIEKNSCYKIKHNYKKQ